MCSQPPDEASRKRRLSLIGMIWLVHERYKYSNTSSQSRRTPPQAISSLYGVVFAECFAFYLYITSGELGGSRNYWVVTYIVGYYRDFTIQCSIFVPVDPKCRVVPASPNCDIR